MNSVKVDVANGTTKHADSQISIFKKRRYIVGCMAFLGFFVSYILRVNLSVSIVAMMAPQPRVNEFGRVVYEKEFDWDSKTVGMVLSSFFYGYMTTQLFGGWLAARIGGKWVFGTGIAVTAFFTIITPPIARFSIYALLAIRVIEGVFEGVTYPCIHAIWACWSPPLERSKLATLAYSGSSIGTVFAMPVVGILSEQFGWEIPFYAFGVGGLLWFAIWAVFMKDDPADDPYITKIELDYIKTSIGNVATGKDIVHPWGAIFKSPAVYAVVAAHVSENWGFYTMLTQLPSFMNDVLNFKLDKTGYLSAIPYLVMSSVVQSSGFVADFLRSREIMTTTQVRKTLTCGAFVCQTIFMVLTGFMTTTTSVVICITLGIGFGGFAYAGFGVNHLDIAPQHASVLMGLGNTLATMPGMISPIVTGFVVQKKTAAEWRIVLIISAAIYLFGAIVYFLFGSGEIQDWALPPKEPETKPEKKSYDNEAVDVEYM